MTGDAETQPLPNLRTDPILIGIDVGSTTVKAAVVDPVTRQILWSDYQRHQTKQAEKVAELLTRIGQDFLRVRQGDIRCFITGSGAGPLAAPIGAKFVQEVNAVNLAVEELHPDVGSVIELGGQDAKIIIFKEAKAAAADLEAAKTIEESRNDAGKQAEGHFQGDETKTTAVARKNKTAIASMDDKCAAGTAADRLAEIAPLLGKSATGIRVAEARRFVGELATALKAAPGKALELRARWTRKAPAFLAQVREEWVDVKPAVAEKMRAHAKAGVAGLRAAVWRPGSPSRSTSAPAAQAQV